jgi:hypothetical protein
MRAHQFEWKSIAVALLVGDDGHIVGKLVKYFTMSSAWQAGPESISFLLNGFWKKSRVSDRMMGV